MNRPRRRLQATTGAETEPHVALSHLGLDVPLASYDITPFLSPDKRGGGGAFFFGGVGGAGGRALF